MYTVMLVEDNPDDEVLTMRALTRAESNLRVLSAKDGLEAMQLLASLSQPPDLILMDLRVPLCSGLELLERVRARSLTRFTPVVMFTSSDEPADRAKAYARGCTCYVRKPFLYDEYMQAVQRTVDFWLKTNLMPPEVRVERHAA